MKNPIQPIAKDSFGTLRFKSNPIVERLLELGQKHGFGLNEIACQSFSDDDRQQFAQLIGYSLNGYSELSYVDSDAYGAAIGVAEERKESAARIRHMEKELHSLRTALRKPMARLFGIHPDDLHIP